MDQQKSKRLSACPWLSLLRAVANPLGAELEASLSLSAAEFISQHRDSRINQRRIRKRRRACREVFTFRTKNRRRIGNVAEPQESIQSLLQFKNRSARGIEAY